MEDDQLDVPFMDEFAAYLATKARLAPKTVRRHVLNASDFVYYMSTHGYEADPDCKEDELPMDAGLLARGNDFSPPTSPTSCHASASRRPPRCARARRA